VNVDKANAAPIAREDDAVLFGPRVYPLDARGRLRVDLWKLSVREKFLLESQRVSHPAFDAVVLWEGEQAE